MAVAACIAWIRGSNGGENRLKKYWICLLIAFVCGILVSERTRNPFGLAKKSGSANSQDQPALNLEAGISQKRPDAETRWASFENPLALKGAGATENQGAKGHPFDS